MGKRCEQRQKKQSDHICLSCRHQHHGRIKFILMLEEDENDVRDIPPQVLKNISRVQVEDMDDMLKWALMLGDPETARVLGISAMPSHAGVSAAPDEPKGKLDGMPNAGEQNLRLCQVIHPRRQSATPARVDTRPAWKSDEA